MNEYNKILKKYFGYSSLKEEQYTVIDNIINKKRDVCAILATGFGKSVCYQLPVLISKKSVIVKTIVKEKRPYIRRQEPPAQCRKEEVRQAPKKDFDPYPEDEPLQTADESTDTQTIKKLERKVKRIEKVEKVIDKPFDKIKAMQNLIF